MSSSASPAPPAHENRQARAEIRAAQACTRCRSRKVRCDGVHPQCGTCVATLVECVWPTLPNRRGRRPARGAASAHPANSRLSRAQASSPGFRYDHSEMPMGAAQYFQERSEEGTSSLRNLHEMEVPPIDRLELQRVIDHAHQVSKKIANPIGVVMGWSWFSTTEIAKHGTPLAAAEFYGKAAVGFLLSGTSMGTLDFIIAMLLLTLHEFSMKRGKEAWLHLGIAIRSVLSLDLGKEVVEDRLTVSPLYAPWKIRECRRRCFWGAFVIERLLASGNHAQNVLSGSPGLPRHHLIDLKDVNIQLPSSENDFMFFRPVLTHDSAELGNRTFYTPSPQGDNIATFGHMVKVCKVWGEITRWAFAPEESAEKLRIETNHAHRNLTQWDTELPKRSKWNFENYSAHSVPGFALGCSFIFMHLVSKIGFVLLGLKTFEYASEELLAYATESNGEHALRPATLQDSKHIIQTAIDSAKFILDISNDPMNLLGTPFLDYALYLSSLFMMKIALLNDNDGVPLNAPKLSTTNFIYQVFSVYKRRIHYWKLTRAYSRVLRAAHAEFTYAKTQSFRTCRFQTSIEYGSIENMEVRDVEIDNEAKDIAEIMAQLVSECSSNTGKPAVHALNDVPDVLDPSQELEILDIDSLLAAQGAANAIQVSLSTNNDRWWNDLFGEEPMNMDHDLLLQQGRKPLKMSTNPITDKDTTHFGLLNMLESDLNVLADSMRTTEAKLGSRIEFSLLVAKLNLYSFGLNQAIKLRTSEATQLRLSAFGCATRLIQLFVATPLISAQADGTDSTRSLPVQTYYPRAYWKSLGYACLALLKLSLTKGLPKFEVIQSEIAIQRAVDLLSTCSTVEGDELHIIARLICLLRQEASQEVVRPRQEVKSRMGASLMYDMVFSVVGWMKQMDPEQRKDSRNLPQNNNSIENASRMDTTFSISEMPPQAMDGLIANSGYLIDSMGLDTNFWDASMFDQLYAFDTVDVEYDTSKFCTILRARFRFDKVQISGGNNEEV
ncbi:hypothetical protein NA57DRAFT_58956 [Rhizodiscina lignyota]|uniref:Zn(2)-C6 fungal-type domain-containing protein n=1 Tax=Rhizodiscina lignyota TaxID=1504668 RepID=A0A9P4I657_9PEZI|nr:hypothetical protein NA57DRAFT_58956 [Rhizodiscina lignyota]